MVHVGFVLLCFGLFIVVVGTSAHLFNTKCAVETSSPFMFKNDPFNHE